MTPTTGTALGILVAFVLPGFVVALFQKRTFKQAEEMNPLNLLLHVLYFSVWCYGVLALVAIVFGLDRACLESLYSDHKNDPAILVFYAGGAIFLPALVVWAWTLFLYQSGLSDWAADKLGINTRHQQPTAWDFWFRKRSEGLVHILYKDGRSVWGEYGHKSFAAYSKDGGDLYLEHTFHEDLTEEDPSPDAPRSGPWFGKGKQNCLGAWVNLSDAVTVEFYNFDPDETPKLSRFQRFRKWVRRASKATDATESEQTIGNGPSEIGAASPDEQTQADTAPSDTTTSEEVRTQ